MRITQGTFSFLPDLNDEQIAAQIQYALDQGWAISLEHTNDPHPRNTYWELDGLPLFDLADASVVLRELDAVRERNPGAYVRVSAFDPRHARATTALSFIVQRPAVEPELRLERRESRGRTERFGLHTVR